MFTLQIAVHNRYMVRKLQRFFMLKMWYIQQPEWEQKFENGTSQHNIHKILPPSFCILHPLPALYRSH
jgi:hypothetical protein